MKHLLPPSEAMAEALKHVYSPAYINQVGAAVAQRHPKFDAAAFTAWVLADDWGRLELKGRMRKICRGLNRHLALPYTQALNILMPVAAQFGGGELGDYPSMFFPDYVECYGLDDYEASITALAHFTQYSSAEFAVRPFIIKYPQQMMQQMLQWAGSDNYYVRRLASEGCRPRLPWAMALPQFKQDPSLILPILERLKNDPHLFVRRSVANNLNDIAKDNPNITIDIAKRWLGNHRDTDWIVKHACRSLLKQGHNEVLPLFGFTPPTGIELTDFHADAALTLGATLNFDFTLKAKQALGKLRLEFGIDFMKKNGKQRRKIFQISEAHIEQTNKTIHKRLALKPISTRRYYSGEHGLAIIVNGQEMAYRTFALKVPR